MVIQQYLDENTLFQMNKK